MQTIKKISWFLLFFAVFILLLDLQAQAMPRWWDGPYGDYCPKRGLYGARKGVRTADEARRILLEYFSGHDIKIGRIDEMRWFFKAFILDRDDNLIDVVIVDKRTGRIRSTY